MSYVTSNCAAMTKPITNSLNMGGINQGGIKLFAESVDDATRYVDFKPAVNYNPTTYLRRAKLSDFFEMSPRRDEQIGGGIIFAMRKREIRVGSDLDD